MLLLPFPAGAEDGTERMAIGAAMLLPRDLSPWGMFLQADIVVKAVMIGLVFATLVTWTVWLSKTIELIRARRNTRSALRELASARSVDDAVRQVPG
ncbi:MAG: tonB-system energizer ExbB, partial [Bradyrhizobium guangdongense]